MARSYREGAQLSRQVARELGNQAGPAGLVRSAEAATGVAVEVLEEQRQVAEARIARELRMRIERRADAVRTRQKSATSRRESSVATSPRFIARPEPVGHSTTKSSP